VIRLITRYPSRKLYDTEESRYVALDELESWIEEGQEIRVIDRETEEDVTSQMLTQLIIERGKREKKFPPSELLHDMIRRGGDLVSNGVEQFSQGVDKLIQAGAERVKPLRDVREETQVLRTRLEELEASLSRLEARAPAESDATAAVKESYPKEVPDVPGKESDDDR